MLYQTIQFSKNFCKQTLYESLACIQQAESFNLVAMAGVGVTFFLKHLEARSKDTFVFINTYEMPEFTKDALYQQIIIKLGGTPARDLQSNIIEARRLLATMLEGQKHKVILVFNRMDRLTKIFDQSLFDNIRYLRDQDRSRVVMVFVSSSRMLDIYGHEIKDILTLWSRSVYFPPYSLEDLREIVRADPREILEETALILSGGHHSLYNVLTHCQNLDNALSDSMVELLIKDLYYSLNHKRRDELERVAKKRVQTKDEYLLYAGFVRQLGGYTDTFTPLLSEYIRESTSSLLPPMEQRLFDVLYEHRGELVGKDVIFDRVWKEQDGIASEWSLNSLVYRLRNHAAFDKTRFVIKSAKKMGYVLYDSLDE